jgi:hypothetical protein
MSKTVEFASTERRDYQLHLQPWVHKPPWNQLFRVQRGHLQTSPRRPKLYAVWPGKVFYKGGTGQ